MNHLKDFVFLLSLVGLSVCLVLANKNTIPAISSKKEVCSKCNKNMPPFDPIKQASPLNVISAGISILHPDFLNPL